MSVSSKKSLATDKPMGSSLSERVRQHALETSGGLAGVHRATSVPKTTLAAWLKGEKAVTSTVLDKICRGYGILPAIPATKLESNAPVPLLHDATVAKSAREADYEREVIRLRYRERELLSQIDMVASRLEGLNAMLRKKG